MAAPMQQFLQTLRENGWAFQLVSRLGQQPVLLQAQRGPVIMRLRVYIWNVRPGGGPPGIRPLDEARIQIMKTPLEFGDDFFTLLLGWDEAHQVFVAWDAAVHADARYSASVQVRVPYIEQAVIRGMEIQHRDQPDENVVITTPDLLSAYIEQATVVHSRQLGVVSPAFPELDTQRIIEDEGLQPIETSTAPAAEPGRVPRTRMSQERRRTISTLRRWWRSSTFPRAVTWAYGYRCATCGIGLNLIEAAHILPVTEEETLEHPSNGLALCPLHHDAYDDGIFGVTGDYAILINQRRIAELETQHRIGGLDKFLSITPLGEKITLPAYVPYRPNPQLLERGLLLRGFE